MKANVSKSNVSDIEDDPELHMTDFDEPSGPAAKKAAPSKTVEFEEPLPTADGKYQRYCRYFVLVMLITFWCIFTLCLTFTVELMEKDGHMAAVPQKGTKMMDLSMFETSERVGVRVKGPFKTGDVEVGDATLAFQIFLGKTPTDNKPVSEVWTLPVDTAEMVYIHPKAERDYIFLVEANRSNDDILYLQLKSDFDTNIAINIWIDVHPVNKDVGIILGALVLIFLYVMIIWEFINRTFASMIAATLSIGILSAMNGRPSISEIMSWVDIETLLLLFGMMILVAILSESGVFDYLAVYAYKITNGQLWPLINCLCLFTAILSAFLDNVTMMLLVTPVIIRLCEVTNLDPVPVIIFLVLYSNIGAAMTPVGDPPNVIITTNSYITAHDVNFGNFFVHMFPGVCLAMLQTYIQLRIQYPDVNDLKLKGSREQHNLRHEIHVWERAAAGMATYSKDEDLVKDTLMKKVDSLKRRISLPDSQVVKAEPNFKETLEQLKATYPIRDKTLLFKSTIAFLFVIMLFFLHSLPHFHYLTLGWTALIGAFLLLILADVTDMEAILGHVEWSTLLFFACLFVLMEALSKLGLIEMVGDFVVDIVMLVQPEKRLMLTLLIILWVSAISSAFLDNIPVTTMMVRIIISLAENKTLKLPLHPLVWALAFGACFGGNGTLIGASANVVSAGVAEQHGYKFTFMKFFQMGFPIMLGNVIMATIYLMLAHVVFQWH